MVGLSEQCAKQQGDWTPPQRSARDFHLEDDSGRVDVHMSFSNVSSTGPDNHISELGLTRWTADHQPEVVRHFADTNSALAAEDRRSGRGHASGVEYE